MCEKCWTPKPGHVTIAEAARRLQIEPGEVVALVLMPVFQGKSIYARRRDLKDAIWKKFGVRFS